MQFSHLQSFPQVVQLQAALGAQQAPFSHLHSVPHLQLGPHLHSDPHLQSLQVQFLLVQADFSFLVPSIDVVKIIILHD